jgi:hypothetical protein
MRPMLIRRFMILMTFLGVSGCHHIGPGTIVDDRIPYNDAIATSWKQQTLLNIVRLRYSDTPEFIDVPSVLSGYGLDRTSSADIGASVFPHDFIANVLTFGWVGTRTVSDRPTITYAPQTGSEFTRNLIQPIQPASILNLIESGTPADVVFELAVESINGIRNRQVFGGQIQPADPEFQQVIHTLKKAQASGFVSLRISSAPEKKSPTVVMTIQDKDIPADLAAELAQLRKMLHLDPKLREFKVVVGMLPDGEDEIAFRTRSVMRIMTFLAINVDVPACHLAEGRAPDLGDMSSSTQPQLTVHSGCQKPYDSFVAVCYQGYWFWIDYSDFNSKRSFLYLKILLALADTGQKEAPPALTIRAN